jgi:ATP-dependent Clp protease, protease subunit
MRDPVRVIEVNTKPFEPFWRFRNEVESESGGVELEFFGPISEYSWWGDEVTPAQFKKDLYANGEGKPITVLVNSPGGEVIAASVIRSMLQEYPGKVTADIVGLAASAATIMITGADHIRIRESGLMMIHDPSMLTWGTIDEIKKALDILKTVKDSIIDTYITKTGMESDKLAKMMTDETWMTAKEAKAFGFVDEVVTTSVKKSQTNTIPTGFVNCLKSYMNVPRELILETFPVSPEDPVGEPSEPPEGNCPAADSQIGPYDGNQNQREAESLREYLKIFLKEEK